MLRPPASTTSASAWPEFRKAKLKEGKPEAWVRLERRPTGAIVTNVLRQRHAGHSFQENAAKRCA
jgi:hypothetical protein